MTGEVKSLFGGFIHQPEVMESVVDALEELLADAKAGKITGIAFATVDFKGAGSYTVAGRVGGYTLLGGLEMLKASLVTFNVGCEDE